MLLCPMSEHRARLGIAAIGNTIAENSDTSGSSLFYEPCERII